MEAVAKLTKTFIAPRKMRLVADLIRGVAVKKAFAILQNEPKKCAIQIEKLLLSAVANWQIKNTKASLESAELYVKTIYVDSAGMLKRLRPAPQGRAHRIRKRFSHVTLIIDEFSLGQYQDNKIDSHDDADAHDIVPMNTMEHTNEHKNGHPVLTEQDNDQMQKNKTEEEKQINQNIN
jgi:large subunit ribosomal protein L22